MIDDPVRTETRDAQAPQPWIPPTLTRLDPQEAETGPSGLADANYLS